MDNAHDRMTPAIVIQSTDDYSFCWDEWHYWFRRYWPSGLAWPVYFISHELRPQYEGVTAVPTGRVDFSTQLIRGLDRIPADTVLYWQVDYWPDGMVSADLWDHLAECFAAHDMDHLRVCYRSENVTLDATPWTVLGRPIWKLKKDTPYKVSHQPSLWRKAALLDTLQLGEDAWHHEMDGTAKMQQRDVGYYQYILQWYVHLVSDNEWCRTQEEMEALRRVPQ